MDQQKVVIESPYSGDIATNVEYALACVQESLSRKEAPFASHLLYTRFPENGSGDYAGHKSDEGDPERRLDGIGAGYRWGKEASLVAMYTDLGISEGMGKAREFYLSRGVRVVYRKLRQTHTKLIAISGKMASGKTTLKNAIIEQNPQLRVASVSIAWPLKKTASELCGMSLEEEKKDRQLLIDLGNVVRAKDVNRLVNMAVEKASHMASYHDVVIIDDLRFRNEAPILRDNGFHLVRLSVSEAVQKERIRAKYPDTFEKHFQKLGSTSEVDLDSFNEWDVVFSSAETPEKMATTILDQSNH